MDSIKEIFDKLYQQPFPSERGMEIEGVDLIMIDADTIGLVSCFLGNKGKLSINQIRILDKCIKDLTLIIPHLGSHEKEYFSSLKNLADKVINLSKS